MMTARSATLSHNAIVANLPARAVQGVRSLVLSMGRKVGVAIRWYIETQGGYYERTGAPYTDDFLM